MIWGLGNKSICVIRQLIKSSKTTTTGKMEWDVKKKKKLYMIINALKYLWIINFKNIWKK